MVKKYAFFYIFTLVLYEIIFLLINNGVFLFPRYGMIKQFHPMRYFD